MIKSDILSNDNTSEIINIFIFRVFVDKFDKSKNQENFGTMKLIHNGILISMYHYELIKIMKNKI